MTKGENGDLGWAQLGRHGRVCVCVFPKPTLFYEKYGGRGGGEEVYAYTVILSLMITLLTCTQTYKNNTALIST